MGTSTFGLQNLQNVASQLDIVFLQSPGNPPHHEQGYVGTLKFASLCLQNKKCQKRKYHAVQALGISHTSPVTFRSVILQSDAEITMLAVFLAKPTSRQRSKETWRIECLIPV